MLIVINESDVKDPENGYGLDKNMIIFCQTPVISQLPKQ